MSQSKESEKTTEKRRDDALRRALSTPPKPKQESEKGKDKKKPTKKPA
jgi:hypothetical protein